LQLERLEQLLPSQLGLEQLQQLEQLQLEWLE